MNETAQLSPHFAVSVYSLGNRYPQVHVVKDSICRIGSAWDNDIVITDPRCPAYIGAIENTQGSLSIQHSQTQDTIASLQLVSLLQSGARLDAKLTNGVKIEVYLSNHISKPVDAESWLQRITHKTPALITATLLLLLHVGLNLWGVVQNRISSFEWSKIINGQIMEVIAIIAVAFILSVIVRFIKQEERFTSLLLLLTLYSISTYMVDLLFHIAYFNSASPFWSFATEFTGAVLLVFSARIIIEQLSSWQLTKVWFISLLIGGFSLYYNYVQYHIIEEDFSYSPRDINVVYPNYFRLVSSDSLSEFVEGNQLLFDEVDKQREKE